MRVIASVNTLIQLVTFAFTVRLLTHTLRWQREAHPFHHGSQNILLLGSAPGAFVEGKERSLAMEKLHRFLSKDMVCPNGCIRRPLTREPPALRGNRTSC